MESRKMVVMNIWAGQEQRLRHREQTCGHRERSTEIYTLPYVKQIASGRYGVSQGAYLVFCDNLEGWNVVGGGREAQEGGNKCIPIADSCCCMAETNTTLWGNYPPIKSK